MRTTTHTGEARLDSGAAAGGSDHASDLRRHGERAYKYAMRGSKHVILIAYGLAAVFPLLLIISTALKTLGDVYRDPFSLFTSFTLSNFSSAWTAGDFGSYLWNSVLLAVPSTAGVVVFSTMAGYAFARLPYRGRTLLFYLVMVGLLIPFFSYMIPLFFEMRGVGLLDTLVGVDCVLCTTGLAVGTFFMRSFFTDLPAEIEQAARIDGCSEWQVFLRVMLPFCRSGALSLMLYMFVQNWNSFLVPLLLLPGGSYRPVTTGLYSWTGRTNDYGAVAAGTVIAILPVVVIFLLTQRQLIRGFAAGAVKG